MDPTHDGGGPTRVAKADDNTALFDWDSALWSSDDGWPEGFNVTYSDLGVGNPRSDRRPR
jgi:hypothetical protein